MGNTFVQGTGRHAIVSCRDRDPEALPPCNGKQRNMLRAAIESTRQPLAPSDNPESDNS
jgi:hypothetical protein